MISAEYCRTMARYNTWQNNSLITAADGLTNVDHWKDRGAFFQSIAATLNHIYWADALILQRLKGNEKRAPQLLDADLNGIVAWYKKGGSIRIERSTALCAAELFNHQTHRRGQVYAMLTAAGAKPEPTNISMML